MEARIFRRKITSKARRKYFDETATVRTEEWFSKTFYKKGKPLFVVCGVPYKKWLKDLQEIPFEDQIE